MDLVALSKLSNVIFTKLFCPELFSVPSPPTKSFRNRWFTQLIHSYIFRLVSIKFDLIAMYRVVYNNWYRCATLPTKFRSSTDLCTLSARCCFMVKALFLMHSSSNSKNIYVSTVTILQLYTIDTHTHRIHAHL